MKKIGLIAGNRHFPLLFSRQAKLKDPDLEIIAVAIKGETEKSLAKYVDKIFWIHIGKLNELTGIFSKEEIKTVVMAGQISPFRIFKDKSNWDDTMRHIIGVISDFRPHSIFTEIIREVEKHNLRFISSITYLEEYLAKEGLNNDIVINDFLRREIKYSVELARKIVDLDIGQTIIFKDKAIVAVEALEGTDNTIKRAHRICGDNFIAVKLAKKNQDLRFDVPVIGLNTIKLLVKLKAKALILEKAKTLILDKQKVINLSDRAQIPIVGVS